MHAVDVVESLGQTANRAEQEQIIRLAYSENCLEFFEVIKLANDPFITFGVTHVAEITVEDGLPGTLTFDEFRQLCYRLNSGEIRDVRAAIHDAAGRCHARTWNRLYRRVLLKKLDVSVELVNDVLKRLGEGAGSLRIPQFGYQRASKLRTLPTEGRYFVEPRIPGERVITVLDRAAVLYDSAGNRLNRAPDLTMAFSKIAEKLQLPVVFDGVLDENSQYYAIFDMLPLDDFRAGFSPITQSDRRIALQALHGTGVFVGPLIRVVPTLEIDFSSNRAGFAEFAADMRTNDYRELLLKQPDAPYHTRRTRAWQRIPVAE